jgi:hypothetical protein
MHKIIQKKKYFQLSSLVLTVILLFIFSSGCGPKYHYKRSTFKTSNIKILAVLPFQNLTTQRYADEKVRSAVIIDLLSRGFDVIEPGEVTRTLRDMGIRSTDSVSSSDIMYIGETFDVKTVMIGSVATFGMSKGISVTYPEVSIHLSLLDTTSGEIMWHVWNTAGGASFWTRHFGAESKTLDETVKDVVKTAIDTLK